MPVRVRPRARCLGVFSIYALFFCMRKSLAKILWIVLFPVWVWGESTPIPSETLQLAVVVAPHASTKNALMRLYRRDHARSPWREETPWWPVLIGKAGMGWGIGLHPPQPGLQKREGDKRAPAGVFKIGRILGHAASLPEGASREWPYRQVTERDVWVDDPKSQFYNRHLILGEDGIPENYDVHRMRLGDNAYRWLVLIEHNYEAPVPYAGSAIFFHVRRGVQRASAGCTVMALEDLEAFIKWLRPEARPVLVQLPLENYLKKQSQWRLPRLKNLPTRPSGLWPQVELGHIRDLNQ